MASVNVTTIEQGQYIYTKLPQQTQEVEGQYTLNTSRHMIHVEPDLSQVLGDKAAAESVRVTSSNGIVTEILSFHPGDMPYVLENDQSSITILTAGH